VRLSQNTFPNFSLCRENKRGGGVLEFLLESRYRSIKGNHRMGKQRLGIRIKSLVTVCGNPGMRGIRVARSER